MEYDKLMKEYEEVKERDPESENEMKEEAEGNDQEWRNKTEGILIIMNASEGHKGEEDDKSGHRHDGSGNGSAQDVGDDAENTS